MDPRLDAEPIPRCAAAVWGVFLELATSRRSAMGAHALTLTDIDAYCRMTGVRLTAWELDTILQLDAVALRAAARRSTEKR